MILPLIIILILSCAVEGFINPSSPSFQRRHWRLATTSTRTITQRLHAKPSPTTTSSYEDTDATSRGLVSSLTRLVNSLSGESNKSKDIITQHDDLTGPSPRTTRAPTSIAELKTRIEADYIENNYLWTGKLDLDCFDPSCKFTDPTLSFEGTETFERNTQNLVPLVERFVQNYQSILLDIRSTPEYIETRWNMVGELNTLFWKPKIDVIGQTKFWFRQSTDGAGSRLQVYDYDEKWEVPAYQALLQLVTPAETFQNSLNKDKP